jgi:hypothetical protein
MDKNKIKTNIDFSTMVLRNLKTKEEISSSPPSDLVHQVLLLDGPCGHTSKILRQIFEESRDMSGTLRIHVANHNTHDFSRLKKQMHNYPDGRSGPLVDVCVNQKIGTYISDTKKAEVHFDAIWFDWCGTFGGNHSGAPHQIFSPREDTRKALEYALTNDAVIGYTVSTRDRHMSHECITYRESYLNMVKDFGWRVKERKEHSYSSIHGDNKSGCSMFTLFVAQARDVEGMCADFSESFKESIRHARALAVFMGMNKNLPVLFSDLGVVARPKPSTNPWDIPLMFTALSPPPVHHPEKRKRSGSHESPPPATKKKRSKDRRGVSKKRSVTVPQSGCCDTQYSDEIPGTLGVPKQGSLGNDRETTTKNEFSCAQILFESLGVGEFILGDVIKWTRDSPLGLKEAANANSMDAILQSVDGVVKEVCNGTSKVEIHYKNRTLSIVQQSRKRNK